MTSKRKVELVPYSSFWEKVFEKEAQNLKKVLKSNIVDIHHIGSTAIPKIKAKPTVDIAVEVHTLDGIDLFSREFEKVGFTPKGEFGIPGRRYFVRYAPDGITHLTHVHVFRHSNPKVYDHLDFRDYLNSEDKVAKEYEKLKVTLKSQFSDKPELYQKGKSDFIEIVLKNLR